MSAFLTGVSSLKGKKRKAEECTVKKDAGLDDEDAMEKSRKQSGFLIWSYDFPSSSKVPKVLKSACKKPASRGTAWGIVINETGISGSLRDWEDGRTDDDGESPLASAAQRR